MAQTSINIRIDDKDKARFGEICEEMGMTMSTAFNVFAKAVIRCGGFPFAVRVDTPNRETRVAMEDVEMGRGLSGPYSSAKALREALDA